MNLEAVYPDRDNPNHEMSFEELRATSRGWMKKQWGPQKQQKPLKEISGNVICKDPSMEQQGEACVDKKLLTQMREALVIEEKPHPPEETVEPTEVYRDRKSEKARRLKTREIKGETQTGQYPLHSKNRTSKVSFSWGKY